MDDTASIQTETFQAEKANGLSIITCAVFIVGEIAGSGVLALPSAVDGSGWFGLVLMVGCCFLSVYTGHILGKTWTIVRERNENYRSGHVRYPYPAIGQAAYGTFGRYLVSVSINFTLFGVAVVFLLLASENITSLVHTYAHKDFSFCFVCIFVAAALTPATWLGTPADFWFVAVGATMATGTACVILLGNIIWDKGHDYKHTTLIHSEVSFTSFFMAFGTIAFAFGGHPAFPTFQTDMKNQKDFGKAVLLGYIIVLLMYFPVSAAGYWVYGDHIKDNVLSSVSEGPARTVVTCLIVMHLLFGFIIVINPFSQEVEHFLKIPEHFTWKRAVSRTAMVLVVLFVAESVPHFGAILSLVGGSTTTLLAYICPPLFYLKLSRQEPSVLDTWAMKAPQNGKEQGGTRRDSSKSETEDSQTVPLWEKVLNYEIVLVGVVVGMAATYSAGKDLVTSGFSVPCYVNVNKAAN